MLDDSDDKSIVDCEDKRKQELIGTIVVGVDKVIMKESKEWITPDAPAKLLTRCPEKVTARTGVKHVLQ